MLATSIMGFRWTLLIVFYLISCAHFQVKRKSRPINSKLMMFYYSEQNDKSNEENDNSKETAEVKTAPTDDSINKKRAFIDEFINKNVITEDDIKQLRSMCASNGEKLEELIKDHTNIPVIPGITHIKGEPGERGLPGIQGIQGEIGFHGFTGPPGTVGEKGDRGLSGIDGRDGLPGTPGLDGLPGQSGLDGSKGPKGATGMPGLPGIPGFQGLKGEKGQKGDSPPINLQGTSQY